MILAVGATVFASPVLALADGASEQQIKQLQAQIDALQKQVDSIKAAPVPAPAPAPAVSSGPSIPSPVAADGTLTLYGVTLYGTVDVGVSNQSHGLNYNADAPQGVAEPWSKYGNKNLTSVTPGGQSQSNIGLKGKEELIDGVYAVFQVEAAFNPVSGTLANGAKSLVDNNGINKAQQTFSADSSRSGQVFSGPANIGVQNATYGTLTFGRHQVPMYDVIKANDPAGGAYAFSAFTGTLPGGGFTQAARLDDSIKYSGQYGPVRYSALYQFPGNSGIAFAHDDAYHVALGYTHTIFSVDGAYSVKKDAVSLAANSTAGSQTVAATLGNTYTATVAGNVDLRPEKVPVKLFGGLEHIQITNPDRAPMLTNDPFTIDGYQTSSVNSTSYGINKVLYVPWLGVSYWPIDPLKLTAAGYLQIQQNYSGLTQSGCLTAGKTTCSGYEWYTSLVADYTFNKRFDAYLGTMYTKVENGLYVNSTAYHNNNLSTMAGLRFQF